MEVKWIAIASTLIFGSMFSVIAVGEYSKGQCHIEGIRAGLTDAAITNICGKAR
jgi:hypothetical protein